MIVIHSWADEIWTSQTERDHCTGNTSSSLESEILNNTTRSRVEFLLRAGTALGARDGKVKRPEFLSPKNCLSSTGNSVRFRCRDSAWRQAESEWQQQFMVLTRGTEGFPGQGRLKV